MRNLIIEAYKISNNFGNDLGMILRSEDKNGGFYQLHIEENQLATSVTDHGGVIAGSMNGTLGVASLAHAIEKNHVVSTIEFKKLYKSCVLKRPIGCSRRGDSCGQTHFCQRIENG
jgi:acyl-coenzyme A thioesterase PaaI-like protein